MIGPSLRLLAAAAALAAPATAVDYLEEQTRRCQLLHPDRCIQSVVRIGSGQSLPFKPESPAELRDAVGERARPLGGLRPAAGLLSAVPDGAAPKEQRLRKAPAQLKLIADKQKTRW